MTTATRASDVQLFKDAIGGLEQSRTDLGKMQNPVLRNKDLDNLISQLFELITELNAIYSNHVEKLEEYSAATILDSTLNKKEKEKEKQIETEHNAFKVNISDLIKKPNTEGLLVDLENIKSKLADPENKQLSTEQELKQESFFASVFNAVIYMLSFLGMDFSKYYIFSEPTTIPKPVDNTIEKQCTTKIRNLFENQIDDKTHAHTASLERKNFSITNQQSTLDDSPLPFQNINDQGQDTETDNEAKQVNKSLS